jgi:hypothetical protein
MSVISVGGYDRADAQPASRTVTSVVSIAGLPRRELFIAPASLAPSAPASTRGPAYCVTLSLSPSAASLRLAPWVVLFSSMTTPF